MSKYLERRCLVNHLKIAWREVRLLCSWRRKRKKKERERERERERESE